jgi:hypothetical protein
MRNLLTLVLACCILSLFAANATAQDVTKFRVRDGHLQSTYNNGVTWQYSGPQEYSRVTGLDAYTRRSQRVYFRVPTPCRAIWLPTLNHTWRQRNYRDGQVVGDWYGGGFGFFRWGHATPLTIQYPY